MKIIPHEMISVIIPTYGGPVFLEKAINSVLNQTFNDWELIIVDDNNPDTEARKQTEDIVTDVITKDNRINYIKHPHNRNGAAARNTGIAIAKGEYISFLDSDDEYLPDRLEKCVSAISSVGKNYAGVFTGCEFRKKGKTYRKYCGVRTGCHLIETLAGNFMFCTGSNLFVRRSIVEQLNGFDENFQRHQDYEFLVRLFDDYSLVALPEILVIKNNENVNVPPVERMIAIKCQYLGKYQGLISALSDEDRNYIYHTNAVAIGEAAISEHKFGLSKEYYKKATDYKPLTAKERLRRFAIYILSLKNGNKKKMCHM